MCEAKDLPSSERDELMGLVTQLQGQVAQLTAAKEELHKQLAELKRAGKRQAAPFSKGGRSSRPKRPGRKPGMGSFSYRKLSRYRNTTESDGTLRQRSPRHLAFSALRSLRRIPWVSACRSTLHKPDSLVKTRFEEVPEI